MAFDPTKPVRTRDGRAVRMIATDLKGEYPIVAVITAKDGTESVQTYTAEGRFFLSALRSDADLINTPEKHVGWINVYLQEGDPFYMPKVWPTKDVADRNAHDDRIACIQIEFEEGQGLDGGAQ